MKLADRCQIPRPMYVLLRRQLAGWDQGLGKDKVRSQKNLINML